MSKRADLQVPLETLLELPLTAEALATVWREAMGWTSDAAVRRRLALELAVLELDRCRELGESQGWTAVLPRLDSWEATWHNLTAVANDDELAACEPQWQGAMNRLVTALQEHVQTSMQGPPATEWETRELVEWAELAWWCWERRRVSGGNEVLRERLCRLGAIAWMALARFRRGTGSGLQASGRAQALLMDLAKITPPDVLWVKYGLQEGLAIHLESGPPADGNWRSWMDWAELIVERSEGEDERKRREAQLWPGLAAMNIAEVLGL